MSPVALGLAVVAVGGGFGIVIMLIAYAVARPERPIPPGL